MQTEVIGVFPIPIYRVKVTESFEAEKEFLRATPMRETDGGYYSHLQSNNTYILEEPSLANLKECIEANVSAYMKNILSFTDEGMITQSWVNKNAPGEGTHLHAHPNSIVSGVYYMGVPEGSGIIRFHRYKHNNMSYYMEPAIDPESACNNFWAFDFIDITVNTGDILFFPSYISHSVPPNPTDQDRWCLAFNSMPVFGVGSRRNLSEMAVKSNNQLDLSKNDPRA